MNKLTLTSAVFMAFAATSVSAHHPSADMNPNYEMVEDQFETVDSPHLDMDMDAMGSAAGTDAGSGAIDDATRALSGWQSNQAQPGEVSLEQPQTGPGPSVDTMGMMDDVGMTLGE